jgi:uncharacterized protein YggL (DUF469 family)
MVSKAEKVAKHMDEFFDKVIEEHINGSRFDGHVGEDNSDFVDVLLSVQKSNDTGFSFDRTAIKGLLLVRISLFFFSFDKTDFDIFVCYGIKFILFP